MADAVLTPHHTAGLTRLEPLRADSVGFKGQFHAMGSPCEVLMRDCTRAEAQKCLQLVSKEAWRIERKFSRYRTDNIVARINNSNGKSVRVDAETAKLIESADALWEISGGLFDISSGCLRRVWKFDRSSRLPEQKKIKQQLRYIGWNKVVWDQNQITLPRHYEIDFGGIGKEYATDRCLDLVIQTGMEDVLVNLGGDIVVNSTDPANRPWSIGIESSHVKLSHDAVITTGRGGVATSGDTNKYLLKDGIRYSHVLDPCTGWPVPGAPQSVTVAAASCTEAGMYSTLAMLYGAGAEQFLVQCDVKHWVQHH